MKSAPLALVAFVGGIVAIIARMASRRASRPGEAARMATFLAQPASAEPRGMGFPKLAGASGEVEIVTERDGLLVFDYKVIKDPGGARQAIVRTPCVVGVLGARCPTLTISRRGLANAPGLAASPGLPDVSFESDMFNREIHVSCPDPRFAHALIDQRMMEWLLLFPSGWGIQISGDRVLVFGQESPRAMQSGPVIEMFNDFRTHIPASVADLYPEGV